MSELDQLNAQLANLAGAAVNSKLNYNDSKKFYNYQMENNLKWMPLYFNEQQRLQRSADEYYWNTYNSPLAQRRAAAQAGLNYAAMQDSGAGFNGSVPEAPKAELPRGNSGLTRVTGYDPIAAMQVAAQKELLSSQANYYDALAGKVKSETGDQGVFQDIQRLERDLMGKRNVSSDLKNSVDQLNLGIAEELRGVTIDSAKRNLDILDQRIYYVETEIEKNWNEIKRDPLVRENLQAQAALAGAQRGFYVALTRLQEKNVELTEVQIRQAYAEYMAEYFDTYEVAPNSGNWMRGIAGGTSAQRMRYALLRALENNADKSGYGFPLLEYSDKHPELSFWRQGVNSVASDAVGKATDALMKWTLK